MAHSATHLSWLGHFKRMNKNKKSKNQFQNWRRPGSCIGEMTTLSFLKGFIKYPFGFSCGLTIIDPRFNIAGLWPFAANNKY